MYKQVFLLIAFDIDDTMASIHAHIATFNGRIDRSSHTTAAYDIVTFL
mgnify:CR=1 FL=1